MTQSHSPFMFETEFTPQGDVLKGPDRKFFSREEADQLAAKARVEGETKARQTVEAEGLRRCRQGRGPPRPRSASSSPCWPNSSAPEAAELAIIAARKIAGAALDKAGDETAANAIAEVVRQLKLNPVITVSVAPESIAEVERRMEQLRRQGLGANLAFVPNPQAKPGDWHVVWGEGSTGFSREGVEAAVEAIIAARMQDPVEPQLELFSAA